ncbi:MAG TPA: type II toxin-antitoxin system death-on-curing family toxin [Rubrobacter sp.]|jgi:death on curing protein|nr:type II toxin-antitoxin system death-on-curing family toxin [Rubrobacter sp.]
MMHTRRTLRKVGGSVMLPIPPEMLEEMRLRAGQDVMLSSEGDVIRVEQYGGSEGVRDEESLLGAIERLWQASFGQEHFVSTFEKAAFLMESTIRRHPFVDGNKRTGAASVSYLLSKFGHNIEAGQQELEDFAVSVAEANVELVEIALWFERSHSPET